MDNQNRGAISRSKSKGRSSKKCSENKLLNGLVSSKQKKQEEKMGFSSLTKLNNDLATLKVKSNSPSASNKMLSQPNHSDVSSQLFPCSYCNVNFSTKAKLQVHCHSQEHQTTIMSDEGRDWLHRPPPRGLPGEAYVLCTTYQESRTCRFGNECVDAHDEAELLEWKERFEYRAMKLSRARENQLHGASYSEQLLEKLAEAQNQENLIVEKVDNAIIHMNSDASIRVSQKPSKHEWVFIIRCPLPLRVVSLLHDAYRNHFAITEASVTDHLNKQHQSVIPEDGQEWHTKNLKDLLTNANTNGLEFSVTVQFTASIYGTFRQAVIFDFGSEPVLAQRLCADVMTLADVCQLEKTTKTMLTPGERWCSENSDVVINTDQSVHSSADCRKLLQKYPAPTNENLVVTQTSITNQPSRNNYQSRSHDLLHIEELAQFILLSQFNLCTSVQLTNNYFLSPTAQSVAKYSHSGELFARLELSDEISEDTPHGRLILSNCWSVLVSLPLNQDKDAQNKEPHKPKEDLPMVSETGKPIAAKRPLRRCYEVSIEDKIRRELYLRLPAAVVSELKLSVDDEVTLEFQFQLNRIPLCEMHSAVDQLPNLDLLFPKMLLDPTVPWNPVRQWKESTKVKMNPKQKEAIMAITAPLSTKLPPVLLIGPFGTGKTYTLAQAVKWILQEEGSRILICTHSNSAADLYIKDYLHPYVESGHKVGRPLRIYYHHRWVPTVHPTVQEYCLIDNDGTERKFRIPNREEILDHRVVVVTLNTSRHLLTIGLSRGTFTHILIDEAAQAMEFETLIPLGLTNTDTRIVLAGDYMQLSPEVFSPFCKERGLGTSLLERLYDLYPSNFPCKILLMENYRSHTAIIKYTSDLFYEGRLIASGKLTPHPKFPPLTFFTARGEDVQDANSTAFHNNSEVYEVCERVSEIIRFWPESDWGPVGENSVGVVTPYSEQVARIRSELRKRKLFKVNVERVLNVQGKQFRVIVLSTVRTRHTCRAADNLDFGFLSNAKLVTTAITRAQSLVAVVGDPVSLCAVGQCRKLWEKFLLLCSEANSLYGITWASLRAQLDGVELKKTYILNPLAPEFIPRLFYYSNLPAYQMPPMTPLMYPNPNMAYRQQQYMAQPHQMINYLSPHWPSQQMPVMPSQQMPILHRAQFPHSERKSPIIPHALVQQQWQPNYLLPYWFQTLAQYQQHLMMPYMPQNFNQVYRNIGYNQNNNVRISNQSLPPIIPWMGYASTVGYASPHQGFLTDHRVNNRQTQHISQGSQHVTMGTLKGTLHREEVKRNKSAVETSSMAKSFSAKPEMNRTDSGFKFLNNVHFPIKAGSGCPASDLEELIDDRINSQRSTPSISSSTCDPVDDQLKAMLPNGDSNLVDSLPTPDVVRSLGDLIGESPTKRSDSWTCPWSSDEIQTSSKIPPNLVQSKSALWFGNEGAKVQTCTELEASLQLGIHPAWGSARTVSERKDNSTLNFSKPTADIQRLVSQDIGSRRSSEILLSSLPLLSLADSGGFPAIGSTNLPLYMRRTRDVAHSKGPVVPLQNTMRSMPLDLRECLAESHENYKKIHPGEFRPAMLPHQQQISSNGDLGLKNLPKSMGILEVEKSYAGAVRSTLNNGFGLNDTCIHDRSDEIELPYRLKK